MCPESSLAPSSASPLCWPTSSHRLHIGRRSPRRGTDGGQVWEVGQVFSANLLVQSDHSVPEPAGGWGVGGYIFHHQTVRLTWEGSEGCEEVFRECCTLEAGPVRGARLPAGAMACSSRARIVWMSAVSRCSRLLSCLETTILYLLLPSPHISMM